MFTLHLKSDAGYADLPLTLLGAPVSIGEARGVRDRSPAGRGPRTSNRDQTLTSGSGSGFKFDPGLAFKPLTFEVSALLPEKFAARADGTVTTPGRDLGTRTVNVPW